MYNLKARQALVCRSSLNLILQPPHRVEFIISCKMKLQFYADTAAHATNVYKLNKRKIHSVLSDDRVNNHVKVSFLS